MQEIQIKRCNARDLNEVFRLERSIFGDEGYSYLTLRQLYDVCGDLFRVAVILEDKITGYTIACPKSDTWLTDKSG